MGELRSWWISPLVTIPESSVFSRSPSAATLPSDAVLDASDLQLFQSPIGPASLNEMDNSPIPLPRWGKGEGKEWARKGPLRNGIRVSWGKERERALK